jgi:hypothetical protein
MIAWLSTIGAVALVVTAVVRMRTRSSPSRRDRPADDGDWPSDQMAL